MNHPEEINDEQEGGHPNEHFDEDGNVVHVANLFFIQGILGQGAFGTVRLARRKMPQNGNNDTHGGGTPPSLPTTPQGESTPGGLISPLIRRRHRRYMMNKSHSAPDDSDFFVKPNTEENNTFLTPERPTHNRQRRRVKAQERQSPSVVGKLGLFIQSRVSFDHDHDDDDSREQLVAVKIFSKSILKRRRTMERDKKSHRVKVRTALQQVEREIALMKKLSHPNLVGLHEVIDSPESDMLYMVLEYMPLGEILTYQNDGTFRRKDPRPGCHKFLVQGIVNGHFNEVQAALYFVDILHGLAYLHQHHVCHRDLKPENILLDARGIAKVGDFGVSHIFDKENDFGVHRQASLVDDDDYESSDESPGPHNKHSVLTRKDTDAALAMKGMAHYGMLTRTEGTWCFWSPEMCEGSQKFSGYAADMWAAGVCLYIFVTGLLPFYSEVPTELFEKISDAEISYEGLGLSPSLVDLLKGCLERDPDRRAGVGDCLQHPFLQVAREKRVKQLTIELENSRKRNIILSEEDIKMAFRIVASVPEKLIKSATKTIHSGAKKLQEGFQAASGRISLGISTASPSSSFTDSGNDLNTEGRQGVFRARLSSVGSSNHSSASGDASSRYNRGIFLHKRSSLGSQNSEEARSQSPAQSPVAAPDHGEVAIKKAVVRMLSGLSSGSVSFGSATSGDEHDLPMILSEDEQQIEEEIENGDTEKMTKEIPADKELESGIEEAQQEGNHQKQSLQVRALSSNDGSSEKTGKKRRKWTKDKNSRCVVQ